MIYQLTHRILRAAPPRGLTRRTASARPLSNASDNRKQRRQLQGSSRPDWRELFRSFEYDDAWSPYIPFIAHKPDEIEFNEKEKSTDSKSNKKSHQVEVKQKPIQDLIEGTWQKRRRGMNLVPLTMRLKDAESSNDIEIQQTTAQYEGRLRWLESQTRFLCSMLDDLYRTGIRRQIDRGRTERCHRVSIGLLV